MGGAKAGGPAGPGAAVVLVLPDTGTVGQPIQDNRCQPRQVFLSRRTSPETHTSLGFCRDGISGKCSFHRAKGHRIDLRQSTPWGGLAVLRHDFPDGSPVTQELVK